MPTLTPEQLQLQPNESPMAYNARIAALRGDTPENTTNMQALTQAKTGAASTMSANDIATTTRNPGESIEDFTKRLQGTPSTPAPDAAKTDANANPPVVGTSDAATAIDKIKAEMNSGLTAPTPFNSVEQYNKLRTDQGIVQDEGELAALNNEMRQGQEALNEFKQTSSQGVSEAGYLGGVSEAEKNLNFRLNSLSLQAQAVTDRINTKNAYIDTALKLGEQDYQTAYTNYTNEYNKNLKAIDLYNTQMDNAKKDALTGFTTLTNLLKDKNLDIKNMDPGMKTQIQTLELKAGLPAGTFEAVFAASPNEKILAPIETANASGGKSIYFFTQGSDGTPHLKQTVNTTGPGGSGNINDPTTQAWVQAVLDGNSTMASVPAAYKNAVALGISNQPAESYSPLAASRFTTAATKIATNFVNLPQFQLTANGLPYLQRIDAAMKTPGSVSDQDLLDSLTKLNTAGNAITDAQVKIITDGKSFADAISAFGNKFKNGGVLSDNQRQQIQSIAKAIYANYQKGYQPVYDQVTSQLSAAGIPKAFWTIPDLNNLSAQASGGSGGPTVDPAGQAIGSTFQFNGHTVKKTGTDTYDIIQ